MELDIKELELYRKINFCNRFEKLSNCYQFDNTFERYSNDEVIKIISANTYKVKYVKSGNFFKIEEKLFDIKFYLHISLKYGNIELIFGSVDIKTNKYITGGPFSRLYGLIKFKEGINLENNIRYPKFRNYDDLRAILKEAFSIYEDFKKELIFQEKIS